MWRVKGDKGELHLKRALSGAVQCAQRSQGQRGLFGGNLAPNNNEQCAAQRRV